MFEATERFLECYKENYSDKIEAEYKNLKDIYNSNQLIEPSQIPQISNTSITICLPEAYANRFLNLTMEVVNQHKSDFAGREVSKAALWIDEGVGLADEPGLKAESLASCQAKLLEEVKNIGQTGPNR